MYYTKKGIPLTISKVLPIEDLWDIHSEKKKKFFLDFFLRDFFQPEPGELKIMKTMEGNEWEIQNKHGSYTKLRLADAHKFLSSFYNYNKEIFENWRSSLNFKPGIWWFSHTLAKLTLQNKFLWKFLARYWMTMFIVYWTLHDI